jgi:hypothetical protein
MEEVKIKKTPMQELANIIISTKQMMAKDEKFKDYDYTLPSDTLIELLNNSFSIEESFIASVFDYAFLQAELREKAEVTSGHEYVKKFLKKDENISSKV